MMIKKPFQAIVPCLLEPNGEAKEFLDIARKPETKKQYHELLKEIGVKPDQTSKKLRERMWEKKNWEDKSTRFARNIRGWFEGLTLRQQYAIYRKHKVKNTPLKRKKSTNKGGIRESVTQDIPLSWS